MCQHWLICFGFWSKSWMKTEKCDRRGWKWRVFGDLARIHVPSQYINMDAEQWSLRWVLLYVAVSICFIFFNHLQSNSIVTRYYEVLIFPQEQSEPLAEMHLDRNDFCDATKLGPEHTKACFLTNVQCRRTYLTNQKINLNFVPYACACS